jgi:hypothetical protein
MELDYITASEAEPTDEILKESERVETKRFGHKEERYIQNTELRGTLARVFTIVIAFWLLAVILILVGNNCNHYNLSDSVLNTLLTTTTIQVLGMMLIILWDLFPGKKNRKIKEA